MSNHSYNEPTQRILSEIAGQPQALKDLTAYYCLGDGLRLLDKLSDTNSPLFVGEGSGFLAACLAARLCLRGGVNARAVEISQAAAWPEAIFDNYSSIFWFASSNEAASPFSFNPNCLVKIISESKSLTINRNKVEFPLCTGDESKIPAKTYTNSLALAWLLSRHLTGVLDGSEEESLKRLRQRVQVMLEGKEAYFDRWQTLLAGTSHWVFVGEDLHEVSARYCSALLAEWAKIPALAVSTTEFKQNYLPLAEEGMAVVGLMGSDHSAKEEYLQQAVQSGATVLSVVEGFPLRLTEPERTSKPVEPGLAPILEAISGQLLAVSMAEKFQSTITI